VKSRWFELKDNAVRLRKRGFSIGKIERRLGVSRSTLSGWFKDITLTERQKEKLLQGWRYGLVKARRKAVLWHNEQKEKRLKDARDQALQILSKIDAEDIHILELALSILYLGEGGKITEETTLGSTDPLILKFFISSLEKIYGFNVDRVHCELHIRADQNHQKVKNFWSKELSLPLKNFKSVIIDKRTVGSKTYKNYKGVCTLRCGNVAIKRRLINLSKLYCEEIVSKRG